MGDRAFCGGLEIKDRGRASWSLNRQRWMSPAAFQIGSS
jgi:hypothetical protein